jgi:hypothetical protein
MQMIINLPVPYKLDISCLTEWHILKESPLIWVMTLYLLNLYTQYYLFITDLILYRYCLLLTGLQLTCTAWVESLNTRDDGRGKTYWSCHKHEYLSLHDVNNCRLSLGVSVIHSLKSNFLRISNHIKLKQKKNCFISHVQNTNALQPNVFVTGIYL